MPSHRADSPTDAMTTLRTRPTGHPPQQRRRDLRARGHATLAGHAQVRTASRAPHRGNPLGTALLEAGEPDGVPGTWGALALDPLFVAGRGDVLADGWAVSEPTAAGLADADPPGAVPARELDDEVAVDGDPQAAARQETVLEKGVDVLEPTPGVLRLDQVWRAAVPATEPAGGTRARASAGRRVATRSAIQRAQLRVAPELSPARRTGGFGVPHVGIVGALGLATIAVPLTGAFAGALPAKEVSGTIAAAASALAPLPPFPLASRPPVTALDDARLLPDEEPAASVPARLAAPRVLLVGGPVSRSNERSVLPGCDGQVPDVSSVQNGQLPASMLCTLWDPKRQLRSDAAVAIAKLNIAYQQHFGHPMCFTDAYRSLGAQIRVKAERGGFAARPGTSEHGWGLAVDLCDGVEAGASNPTYQWLRENAPFYGWQNPKWALPGGAGPFEPWHWEYFPGEKEQSSGD